MAALEALYQQDPFWIWLALGSLFVSLSLATGSGALVWPGLAAVGVALLEAVGLRLGLAIEAALFVALSLAALALPYARAALRPLAAAGGGDGAARSPDPIGADPQARTARLVGRIGRTNSEFVNGVGRVWIDGAEWGADLDGGDGTLSAGATVRVVRVIGGIRLQVHALKTG